MGKCFIISTQFVSNVQLKDLTNMFCFWILFHKLYKQGVFYFVFTLKYMSQFGMSLRKYNLKDEA
jgi:hypothetical protein